MLLELRAENYAVIDHAIAVFGPGLAGWLVGLIGFLFFRPEENGQR